MSDNDNDQSTCPCAVCSVLRVVDSRLSNKPTDEEVSEVFRGLAVGVSAIAGMNSNPVAVVQAFLTMLQFTLNEAQLNVPPIEAKTSDAPPLNRRH